MNTGKWFVPIILSLFVVIFTACSSVSASQPPTWHIASLNTSGVVTGIAVLNQADAWAVGYKQETIESYVPLLFHWDGSKWMTLQAPFDHGQLFGITKTDNGFSAVGRQATGKNSNNILLTYSQNKWEILVLNTELDSPLRHIVNIDNTLYVVGGYDHPLIMKLSQNKWQEEVLPSSVAHDTGEVTAIAGNGIDLWAIGVTGGDSSNPLILHYSGGRWLQVNETVPEVTGTRQCLLTSVAMIDNTVYISGNCNASPPFKNEEPFIIKLAPHGVWQKLSAPMPIGSNVSGITTGNTPALYVYGQTDAYPVLVEQFDFKGNTWLHLGNPQEVDGKKFSPDSLIKQVVVGDDGTIWIVGQYNTDNNPTYLLPLIQYYTY